MPRSADISHAARRRDGEMAKRRAISETDSEKCAGGPTQKSAPKSMSIASLLAELPALARLMVTRFQQSWPGRRPPTCNAPP